MQPVSINSSIAQRVSGLSKVYVIALRIPHCIFMGPVDIEFPNEFHGLL
jgi:hypothetical protein